MNPEQAQQIDWTPELALEALIAGNRRFTENRRLEHDLLQQVQATSEGQRPFAVILSCIDSRIPPEVIFDRGIGDMFCIRIAGNFVNDDILGSMEFGCQVAGARLLVVMGHNHCGAISGACDQVELGNLTTMLQKLQPALDATPQPAEPAVRNSGNPAFVQAVAERNVDLTVDAIRQRSSIMRQLEDSGTVRVVGAMYDLETGVVEFSS